MAIVSSMEYLPFELFDNIFNNITDHKDLLQIRAVNKFYERIFTPRSFQAIALQSGPEGQGKFNYIASSRFAEFVHELSFQICLEQSCEMTPSRERYPIAYNSPDGPSIRRFINLKRIVVYLPNQACMACHIEFQHSMLEALKESQSNISSLTITNFRSREKTSTHVNNPEFQSFLSRLTHLSIEFSEEQSVDISLLQDFLKPTQANLETLVLKSHSWMEFPTGLEFTNLKTLELHWFVLSKPVTTILTSNSVSSSLRELRLSHVAFCHEGDKSYRGQTAGDNITTCTAILKEFQDRLKGLRRFEVENGIEYIERDGGSEYKSFTPEWEHVFADKKALNALWRHIGQDTRVKLDEGVYTFHRSRI